jgi:hypothetical protein
MLQVLQLMCHEHARRVSQQTADDAVEEAPTDGLHIDRSNQYNLITLLQANHQDSG